MVVDQYTAFIKHKIECFKPLIKMKDKLNIVSKWYVPISYALLAFVNECILYQCKTLLFLFSKMKIKWYNVQPKLCLEYTKSVIISFVLLITCILNYILQNLLFLFLLLLLLILPFLLLLPLLLLLILLVMWCNGGHPVYPQIYISRIAD